MKATSSRLPFPFLARPRERAKITLSLGFLETGKVFVGTYVFEEWERNGFERTATMIYKAADHAETLKEPKTRSWTGKTFGQIAEAIAAEHNLKPVISDKLKDHQVDYVAQTEESDQNFLTRLGRKLGAVIAPKDGHLLVTERHSGKTASGKDMPKIYVIPTRLISDSAYYVRLKPRSRFSKVIAKWEERSTGKTRNLSLKAGDKGPSYTLREVFQNEADARKAGKAKVKELRAGEGEFSATLVGDPKARAEAPIIVQGVAPDADGEWLCSSVTHVWDYGEDGGATTTIEAQFGMDGEEKKEDSGNTKRNRTRSKTTNPGNTGSGEYVSILDL